MTFKDGNPGCCGCGCGVFTLLADDMMTIAGDGDFNNMTEGTIVVSKKAVLRQSMIENARLFLEHFTIANADVLAMRLLSNVELVNTGTESEPVFELGDHMFLEVQTGGATSLALLAIPGWYARIGIVVDGVETTLGHQAFSADGPTLPRHFTELTRGNFLWDYNDNGVLPSTDGSTFFLPGVLFGNLGPTIYKVAKSVTVLFSDGELNVESGDFLVTEGGDPTLLATWSVVDSLESLEVRSLSYGRSFLSQPIADSLPEDMPVGQRVGVQMVKAPLRDAELSFDAGSVSETVFDGDRFVTNSGATSFAFVGRYQPIAGVMEFAEVKQGLLFAVPAGKSVVKAELLIASGLAYYPETQVPVSCAIVSAEGFADVDQNVDVDDYDFESLFATDTAPLLIESAVDGVRIDVTAKVSAILGETSSGHPLHVMFKVSGTTDRMVRYDVNLLLHTARGPVDRELTTLRVNETTDPLVKYCDRLRPDLWRHTVVEESGVLSRYPAASVTSTLDLYNLTVSQFEPFFPGLDIVSVIPQVVGPDAYAGGRFTFQSNTPFRYSASYRIFHEVVENGVARQSLIPVEVILDFGAGNVQVPSRWSSESLLGGRIRMVYAGFLNFGFAAFELSNAERPYNAEPFSVSTSFTVPDQSSKSAMQSLVAGHTITATFADPLLD